MHLHAQLRMFRLFCKRLGSRYELQNLQKVTRLKRHFVFHNASASVESANSEIKKVLQGRRGRMTDKDFENLTLLNAKKCKAADML